MVVPQIEHSTLSAPRGYISTTRHCGDEQTSWAMSCWSAEAEAEPEPPAPEPAEGDEGPPPALLLPALVMWPQRAQRTFWAPCWLLIVFCFVFRWR